MSDSSQASSQNQQKHQQSIDSSRTSVTFTSPSAAGGQGKPPKRVGNASPQTMVGAGAGSGGMSSFFISSLQQQQPQHVASSSVAATEGSPPSSPRSTFSSVHSYGHEAYSPAIPAGGGSIDMVASRTPTVAAGYASDAAEAEAAAREACATLNQADTCRDPSGLDGDFEVTVSLPESQFSCAHFVAYKGFRERLHGHNYQVTARLSGPLGSDGYVLDFSNVKRVVRDACKSLNEYTIVPMRSDVLEITQEGPSIRLRCEDGSEFLLPRSDCLCLPIVHATSEELCAYLWQSIVDGLTDGLLKKRRIRWLEVAISERMTQTAVYRREL